MMSKKEICVTSPDGQIDLRVELEGPLTFSVFFHNHTVITHSPLSFMIDGVDLAAGVTVGDVVRYDINETYAWRGVHSKAVDFCNGANIALSKAEIKFELELRAYNDGVAFRWVVPGDGVRMPDEATKFVLPTGSTVWYHDLEGHYEGIHQKRNITDAQAGDWAAPPVTFKLPHGAGYASITEAALVNYAGMALQADGKNGFDLVLGHKHHVSYPYRLRYSEEDIKQLSQLAAIAGTITTPWRVVMVGANLNALVNCDVIQNLCPSPDQTFFPDGFDTDWVRPGRAVWRYLDGGERTLEEMKLFSRLAGELGFEHHVIEGFWREWPVDDVKELVRYSREHNVGIWLWKHSKSLWDADERRAFFELCHEVGAVGAKIDFFDHEAHDVIEHYQTLLRESAAHKIMVNFHGSNKSTGESRTWPHELTREGIRGMEYRRTQERAQHGATLPFTRFLAGHADYTPVHFGERLADTSWAHQVASGAIFTSSLLTYAAHPQTLIEHPCAPIIKSIPAVWDETIVLPGSEIGELAAFARRSGEMWILAVMNGPVSKTLDVPLSFLCEGDYDALLAFDRLDEAAAVEIKEAKYKRQDALTIDMRAGGGFVGRFVKV